jgi:hypothetical protein
MNKHEASRTLVKSRPELWAECSDAATLSRHLSEPFGEIRITRLEPETAIAWEGEHVSGTVRLEPSGWGTRVTLTVHDGSADETSDGDASEASEEPVERDTTAARTHARRRRFTSRIRAFIRARAPEYTTSPEQPVPQGDAPADSFPPAGASTGEGAAGAVAAEGAALPPDAALSAALDSLGQAHHRPFSRG